MRNRIAVIMLLLAAGVAQAYDISDLEGTWDFHYLVSGDYPQWTGWVYGTENTNANGDCTFTSITRSDGNPNLPPDTTMAISPSGVVTILETNFHGIMNSQKDMIVGVMTDGDEGYGLIIFTKQVTSTYTTSDLEGTWDFHYLVSGDYPQWTGWVYGTESIGANGDCTFTSITRSDGDPNLPPDTTTAISPSGVVTIPETNFHGIMNSQKDMIVGVMTDGGGGYGLMTFTKQVTSTYTTSDLEGTWDFHYLVSGDSSQWTGWIYGTENTGANGDCTFTSITKSDGNPNLPPDTTMAISPSGVVTIPETNFHGIMNSQKDMIVGVMTDGGGGYGIDFILKHLIIPFGGKTKAEFVDTNNCLVSVYLTGPGTGEVYIPSGGQGDAKRIVLYDTTEKSTLVIKTLTKGKETGVGDIIVDGSLKAILAKTTDLRGDITVTGSLGSITFDDIADEHTITIGPSANPKAGVVMKFDQVSDLTIDSQMPIKALTATEWLGESINAPSVGSITTKGNKKRGIAGNLDIDVTLDGAVNSVKVAGTLFGVWTCDAIKSISSTDIIEANLILSQKPDAKILALGKLTAKGWIDSSRILSTGNIGTVSAGVIVDSSCFAGVTDTNDLNADGVLDLPDPAVDVNYVEPATIKSITVKGIKGEQYCVINSNISAAQILSASLAYPENDNSGIPFGLSAGFIKALKIKDAEGTESWKNLDKPSDSEEFGDAKVLLY